MLGFAATQTTEAGKDTTAGAVVQLRLKTDRGVVHVWVRRPGSGTGDVRVVLPGVSRLTLYAAKTTAIAADGGGDGGGRVVHFVDTSVPHAVVFVGDGDELSRLKIRAEAMAVRAALPDDMKSTNVNFGQVVVRGGDGGERERGMIRVRTFERGVEDETLACGTGSAAVAYVARAAGLLSATCREVDVVVAGGVTILVHLPPLQSSSDVIDGDVTADADDDDGQQSSSSSSSLAIEGPACVSFRGSFVPADLGLSL
jgi:diaminopimelate epimerase